jgi:uncharacterized protein
MSQEEQDSRIDYIEFPVTDIAAAKSFYGAAFGWKLQDWGPDYTSFEDGRLTGGFHAVQSVTPGGPLVVLYAVRLEDMLERVRAAGGTITREIFSFPGGRRFQFRDPSGHELGVWSER